ncbi:MAG: CotH kinase family protein [Myxococcales bacterium]|nr:CotH kinase family protein [Myxococcales bacterium]
MRPLLLVIPAVMLAACGSPAAQPDATGVDAATDGASGGVPDYGRLFPSDRVIDIALDTAAADWAALMADPLNDALQVPATVTYDGVVVTQVGLSTKGNSSRNSVRAMGSQRYSFKLDTDDLVPGQRLLGVDKLNLHNSFKDPTLLRETIGYAMMSGAGVPASRTAFARLTINGQPWGLYVVVEQVEADFLRDRFGAAGGELLKPDQPSGQLTYRGATFADYPGIDVKTDGGDPTHQRFLDLIAALDHGTEQELAAVLDVDRLLPWLAINTYLANLDSYAGSAHNYYLYLDPASARWILIPWDLNETFGTFRCGWTAATIVALDHLQPRCNQPAPRPLITRVLASPTWRARYQALLTELIAGAGAPAAVRVDVDARGSLIRDAVAADPTKFFTLAQFDTALHDDLPVTNQPGIDTAILGLATFAERRSAALAAQLP